MESMFAVPLSVVLVFVLVSAGTDLWKFRIYNALTIPLFLSGLVYNGCLSQANGLSYGVAGVLVGTLPYVALYAMGGMGAGDLKLMAGVGAWLGPWFTLHVLIVSGLATGCYSAVLLLRNRRQTSIESPATVIGDDPTLENRVRLNDRDLTEILTRPDRRLKAIPFGAMIALGVIGAIVWVG